MNSCVAYVLDKRRTCLLADAADRAGGARLVSSAAGTSDVTCMLGLICVHQQITPNVRTGQQCPNPNSHSVSRYIPVARWRW